MRASRVSAAFLLFALTACVTSGPPTGEAAIADRLLFGRAIPDGGNVSQEEWDAFVAEVVTPRFPDGLSIWSGQGQWRDARGNVVREEMFAIEILHPGTPKDNAAIGEIATEYKRRFRQEAVLRVSARSVMRFY